MLNTHYKLFVPPKIKKSRAATEYKYKHLNRQKILYYRGLKLIVKSLGIFKLKKYFLYFNLLKYYLS